MVVAYKCPNCGSSMEFSSEQQLMVCDHCGTEKLIEEMEALELEEEQEIYNQEEHSDDFGVNMENFKRYKCPTCSAEILTDEYTTATFCSFCGNPSLMEDRLAGEKTPALLIPFKINKQQAIEIYRSWCKKGVLTPTEFLEQSTIEKITGMYVPFWMYDYSANALVNAHATRVRRNRKGNTEYIHTDHFNVYRNVSANYTKVPADASAKMPDDVMDKLEPFNYSELKEFQMPYLSGFFAEKYNYTSEELASRIENRIRDYIRSEARGTIQGYATTSITSERLNLSRKHAKYVLFPAWILNYRYKGKQYLFTINGQTGKMVGDLPISIGKGFGWFGGITTVVFLILLVIGRFL